MIDVVVTGAAVASPVLRRPEDVLDGPQAPEAGFDPAAMLGGRGLRYKDRATRLALLACTRLLAQASLLDSGARVGVVASSNLGNLDTVCRTVDTIAERSVTAVSPMDLPNASSNVIASTIAVKFGLRGPNVMVCNGQSSGLDAVYLGKMLISAGRVGTVVVVGVEPVNDVVIELAGAGAETLFDGAAAVLLESLDAATARKAKPRARLVGYARRAGADDSVVRALGGRTPPALWLAGEKDDGPTVLRDVPRRDLEAALGAASGALGVLQVVAAIHWLDSNDAGPVLATAGAAEDGISSLLLTEPGGKP